MQIGAQFYTIRDFCKTPEDLAESLKKVADIGYPTVQISGTCPFDPTWLRAELDKNGLKCVLTHTPPAQMIENPVQVARNHDILGCDRVGLGHYGFYLEKGEGMEDFLNRYRPVAQALQAEGKQFMYHNHAREFQKENGRLILEQIAEALPEIGITLDTYWVQVGGGDPAQWIEKLSGRVPCIHLKDYAYRHNDTTHGPAMAVLGEGNINFDRVFEKAESAGVEYMLVEQDNCYGEDPFDCLKRSYDYLKACGF